MIFSNKKKFIFMSNFSPSEVLKELTECCEFYKDAYDGYYEEEEDCPGVDLTILWETLIEISKNDVTMLGKFYKQLNVLTKYDKEFIEKNPPFVLNLISIFSDISQTSEERSSLLLSLVRLLPFFNKENTMKVIHGMVDLSNFLLKKENKIPSCMNRAMKEIITSSIQKQIIHDIFDILQQEAQGEKKAAATICIACFIDAFLEKQENERILLDNVRQCINGSNSEMLAGCFLLSKIAPYLDDTDDFDAEEVLSLLIPSLSCDDEERRETALETFKTLSDNEVILTEQASNKFISCFSMFQSDDSIQVFFKCLRMLIKANMVVKDEDLNIEEEDFDEDPKEENTEEEDQFCPAEEEEGNEEKESYEYVIPIRDFLLNNLKTTSPTSILSEVIHSIANIVKLSKQLLLESRAQVLEFIFKQIDVNNISLFSSISVFIKCSLENDFITTTGKLALRIRKLLNAKIQNKYEKLKIAENISSIARTVRKSFINPLFDIGYDSIATNDEDIIVICANILGSLSRSLDKQQITNTFEEISRKTLQASNHKSFEALMKQMSQIISNKFISTEQVVYFMDKIVSSQIPLLNGTQINKATPPHIEAIRFIRAAIELNKAPNAVKIIFTLINDATRSITTELILCGTSALNKNMFNKEELKEFTSHVVSFFKNSSLTHENTIIASSDFLREAYQRDPTIFDIKEITKKACELVDDAKDDYYYEEEDTQETTYESMMPLALLVFSIYMSNTNFKVNNILCKNLLNLATISTDDDHSPLFVSLIAQMYQSGDRFNCIQVASLQTFATILTMNQSTRSQLDLKEDDLNSMEQAIKEAISYDSSFIPLITEDISKSKKKMENFNKIIQ